MSIHWHDDEHGFCPCDETGPYVVPTGVAMLTPPGEEPTFLVDYEEAADQWVGHCDQHGEILRRNAGVDDHNAVIIALARHDEFQHGGDGKVHWQMWCI